MSGISLMLLILIALLLPVPFVRMAPGPTFNVIGERDGKQILYLPVTNYVAGNLDVVREMIDRPNTLLGLGDGGALEAGQQGTGTTTDTYSADPTALPPTFYTGDGNGVWRADVKYDWQSLPDGKGSATSRRRWTTTPWWWVRARWICGSNPAPPTRTSR